MTNVGKYSLEHMGLVCDDHHWSKSISHRVLTLKTAFVWCIACPWNGSGISFQIVPHSPAACRKAEKETLKQETLHRTLEYLVDI